MDKSQNLRQIVASLNKLNLDELIALNRAVVKRIRIIDDARNLIANASFDIGDHVSWNDMEGNYHEGHVIRVNKKTISVEEENDDAGIWRIPAYLLQKLDR
jgi:hypothetical protein